MQKPDFLIKAGFTFHNTKKQKKTYQTLTAIIISEILFYFSKLCVWKGK